MVVVRILEYPNNFSFRLKPEAAIQRYSVKKGLKKINPIFKGKQLMLESCFFKYCKLEVCNFIKKRFQHWCFPVNFATFFKILF